jgi:hypothetical protein
MVCRYQVYRSASAAIARLQFYLRQGTVLPLTRANDTTNTNINISIDNNTDRMTLSATALFTATTNDYLNVMMIGDFPAGNLGIEATTGLVETGGFTTPAARSVTLIITKIR